MKKVSVLFTSTLFFVSFLFWGCGSAGDGERAQQQEESAESAPAVFGDDFDFAGTWVGEFQGEKVELHLNTDGSAQIDFVSQGETVNLLGWDMEMVGSDNVRNVILRHARPIRLNFRYQSQDHLRVPAGLKLRDGRPVTEDGWMDWKRE